MLDMYKVKLDCNANDKRFNCDYQTFYVSGTKLGII